VLRAVAHADFLERVRDGRLALGGGHAAEGEREFDVLVNREIADQIERLENESDFAITDPGALRQGKC